MKKSKTMCALHRLIVIFIVANIIAFALMPLFVLTVFEEQLGVYDDSIVISTIVFVYCMAVPYITALFYCATLAKNAVDNSVFSKSCVKYLNAISICSLVEMVMCILGAALYFFVINGKLTIIIMFLALVCCSGVFLAATFSEVVSRAIKLKEENDLTI